MNENNKLPRFLMILCILSLIAAGFMSLYYLMMLSIDPDQKQEIAKMTQTMTRQMSGIEMPQDQLSSIFKMFDYAVYNLSFNIIEIIGVIFLLFKRPIGFHIYAASQIAMIWATYMIFGAGGTMIILFNILFIIFYYRATRQLEQAIHDGTSNE